MKRFLLLFLLLSSSIFYAQNIIEGVFTDSIHHIKNIGLYKFTNGQPKYLTYVQVKNNGFSFDTQNLKTGYYRVLYKNTHNGYVDFIYNNEKVSLKVDSEIGNNSVEFISSTENQLLQSYNYNMSYMQRKLDSTQVALLKNPNTSVKKYQDIQKKIVGAQNYFEQLASDAYALNFIKGSKRNNPTLPFKNADVYLKNLNNHFLDHVDFDNPVLFNSLLFGDKISEYVFYIQKSNHVNQQNSLYQKAILNILSKINKPIVKESMINMLLRRFTYLENIELTTFLISNYKTLPEEVKSKSTLEKTYNALKTMIGVKAPNIKLSKKESLYSLKKSDQYLLIFWSSTCGHCAAELPKVYNLLEKNKDLKVITIGLEDAEDKQNWINETKFYPNWQNIIALDKWDSKVANDYNINATPSYFILDSDYIIIAKPKNIEELDKLF